MLHPLGLKLKFGRNAFGQTGLWKKYRQPYYFLLVRKEEERESKKLFPFEV
jgi:hypothetical protein